MQLPVYVLARFARDAAVSSHDMRRSFGPGYEIGFMKGSFVVDTPMRGENIWKLNCVGIAAILNENEVDSRP